MIDKKYVEKVIKSKPMPHSLEIGYKENHMEERINSVHQRCIELFNENEDAPKAFQRHLQQILPTIAYYEDLLEYYGNQEEALAFMDRYILEEIKDMAKNFQRILKLPGLYKLIPSLFKIGVKMMFNEAAGFGMTELKEDGFCADMHICPYAKTCQKYNCFEIAHYFCDSDDISYGNMHSKLEWKRTKTIGRGNEICDFRLKVKK